MALIIILNINNRMRKQKQGKKGQVAKYITRSKAIRKLQLSLKDFRRMCILKGVYPREPPKKLKKHNRTYYHNKDINFLSLDPLLSRIRAQKIHLRKYRRAKAIGNIGSIRYLVAHKPKLSMNHLVRERYPDFLDALRDLEDPLSLISLFAIFPTHKEFGLSNATIEACSHLMKHLELYIIKSHCLKKSFASIKGIYYQLEIMGVNITYIIPYRYPPTLPINVDYRVMSTFLDFYVVMLKFVLFKLFSSLNLQYPPELKATQDTPTYSDYELKAIEATQEKDEKYKIDEEFANVPQETENLLFSHLKFFLSTEVPRYSVELVVLGAGGSISTDPNDPTITHYITDRQNVAQKKTREYVQPQWVFDSLNFNRLLNVQEYWVGKELPPHVSPFGDENDLDRYMPQREIDLREGTECQAAPKAPKETKQPSKATDIYDITQEKKNEKKQKKQDTKDLAEMSKALMSKKNYKLLNGIRMGQKKKDEQKNRLIAKSQKLNN